MCKENEFKIGLSTCKAIFGAIGPKVHLNVDTFVKIGSRDLTSFLLYCHPPPPLCPKMGGGVEISIFQLLAEFTKFKNLCKITVTNCKFRKLLLKVRFLKPTSALTNKNVVSEKNMLEI